MPAHVRRLGLPVHQNRGQRLRHTRGLQAMDPKPRPSTLASDQPVDPSRLAVVALSRPNQVGSAERTWVRMRTGGM
jgi:hypothetical protein